MPDTGSLVKPFSITGQFKQNVESIIFSGAITSSNIPRFSGTVYYNPNFNNHNYYPAYSNVEAVPNTDLDSSATNEFNTLNNIGQASKIIKAYDIYITLFSIIKRLTRVRNFYSEWYHICNDGTWAFVANKSGKAIFKENLSSIQTGGLVQNSPTFAWNRSINGTTIQNISVNNSTVSENKIISAESINSFFSALISSWRSAANNVIRYTFFSCHNNCYCCHSSCHGNSGRSRR